ncbi:MAG: RcnB family protein [Caulobacter sp.]|jgi:Ni/Co efflux regulator RcnB|nr:RcnB family protein [Caulobacter sp.]
MKKILTAAIALGVLATTATAGAASAQPYRGGNDNNGRYEQRYDRGEQRAEQRRDNRYERRAERRYNGGRYEHPRGYQARSWHRGDRLPPAYRGNAYRVDYRTYRLAPPPRGYEYRRVGDDVVLTAIATGIITSVLIGMFN